jgi:transcription elongation factor GreA
VGYGAVVFVRDQDSGEERFYTLVAGDPTDLDASQVSLASTPGQALLGRRPGDEVEVETPYREVRLRVVTVPTLPRRLGLPATPAPG